jgi:hypothetical protein
MVVDRGRIHPGSLNDGAQGGSRKPLFRKELFRVVDDNVFGSLFTHGYSSKGSWLFNQAID